MLGSDARTITHRWRGMQTQSPFPYAISVGESLHDHIQWWWYNTICSKVQCEAELILSWGLFMWRCEDKAEDVKVEAEDVKLPLCECDAYWRVQTGGIMLSVLRTDIVRISQYHNLGRTWGHQQNIVHSTSVNSMEVIKLALWAFLCQPS